MAKPGGPSKIAGPFIPLPKEIVHLLKKETPVCMTGYILMLAEFYIEEVTDTEGIWIAGRIHTTINGVALKVSKSRGHFRQDIWPRWKEIGIAEIRDGGIYLPRLYKKGEAYIQPLRLRQEIDDMKARQSELKMESTEMQQTITNLLTLLSESQDVKALATIPERPDLITQRPDQASQGSSPLSLLSSSLSLIPLTQKHLHISRFHRAIGKKRIAKAVRERSIEIWKALEKDGYKPGEIAYALEWIPDHAKEPVESFGIVPHMIEDALEFGIKKLEAEKAKAAIEKQRQSSHQQILTEQEEREALKTYKDQLSPDARQDLREKAIQELKDTPGIKTDMILDVLIEVVENKLIRKLDLI